MQFILDTVRIHFCFVTMHLQQPTKSCWYDFIWIKKTNRVLSGEWIKWK